MLGHADYVTVYHDYQVPLRLAPLETPIQKSQKTTPVISRLALPHDTGWYIGAVGQSNTVSCPAALA